MGNSDALGTLWAKLLAGEVTEVYVAGAAFDVHLPQTLGLEPIAYAAYLYDRRTGEPRDAEQLSEIASGISAEPWWIAGGGPWFWDSHFAERAEVALVFNTLLDNPRPAPPTTISVEAGARWLYHRWRGKRGPDSDTASAFDSWQPPTATAGSLAEAMVVPRAQTAAATAVQLLMEQYREKTFVIKDREHIRALRNVRARRP
jgi:hypothetical protein